MALVEFMEQFIKDRFIRAWSRVAIALRAIKRNDYTDPEPTYYCGAQYCDDPVCGTHGSDWQEWRRQQ